MIRLAKIEDLDSINKLGLLISDIFTLKIEEDDLYSRIFEKS